MSAGRPSLYSDELAARICEEVASGRSLRSICADDDMPECRTIFRWLAKHDRFSQQYAHACADRATAMAEETLEIADEECTDAVAAQRNRLRVDTRKWLLSKMAPKKYGDAVKVSGDPEAPVEHKHSVSEAAMALLHKLDKARRGEE